MSSSVQPVGTYSLGRAVESLFGAPPPHLRSSQAFRARGLYNWYRLVHFSRINDQSENAYIETSFSPDQLRSFRLLWEWWTAQYQDPILSLHWISELLNHYEGSYHALNRDLCQWGLRHTTISIPEVQLETLQNFLKVRGGTAKDSHPLAVRHQKTGYHATASQLFWSEFCSSSNYQDYDSFDVFRQDLAQERQHLCENAYVQSTAISAYRALLQNDSQWTGMDDETATWPHYVNIWEDMPWYPYAAWSPVFSACPWLGDTQQNLSDAPYYLWDIIDKQTVLVEDLEDFPDYTAVSHTWGRFVPDWNDKICLPSVPWSIPRNTAFEVERLPDLLDELPTLTRYVWFDLLCIPQDRSDLANREIARQAVIFRNALHATAWFNEVFTLDPIKALVQWMSLKLLQFVDGTKEETYRQKFVAKAWAELEGCQTGLVMSKTLETSEAMLDANNWSTSLWTLQEVCLRPDMWFLDKDLDYLSVEEGICLTLSGLVAMFTGFQSSFEASGEGFPRFLMTLGEELHSHPALYELQCWLYMTGLDKLNGMTQTDILALGDRRYCKELRAEAIMSAIGATNWYNVTPAAEMVLDKYPLSFVREICACNPAQFFGSYLKFNMKPTGFPAGQRDAASGHSALDSEHDEDGPSKSLEGTMLPFSRELAFYADVGTFGSFLPAHTSIVSWNVLASGAVHMSEACILSSPEIAASDSRAHGLARPGAMVMGVSDRGARRLSHAQISEAPFSIDLHDFVRTRNWSAYALVVQHRTSAKADATIMAQGVILREQYSVETDMSQQGCRQFVKVGLFAALLKGSPAVLPETKNVDWMVL